MNLPPSSPKLDRLGITFGLVVSVVLSSSLVIAGLKAGITPGVSPLVILFAWGAFTKKVASGGGTRFLNLAQVAGSSGMAVTAGVIFTAPAVQILYRNKGLEVPPVDVLSLIILSMAGALIGFGFVGLTTRKFLSDPSLPAPEAHACETMIEAAAADPTKRPNLPKSLYLGMLAGVIVPLLVKMHFIKGALATKVLRRDQEFQFALPLDVMVIGIGVLLTLGTGLLVFAGAALRYFGEFFLTGSMTEAGTVMTAKEIEFFMRWVGGGAMGVAVIWSLLRFVQAKTGGNHDDDPRGILEVSPGTKAFLKGSIAVGMAILFVWLVGKEGFGLYSISMSGAILACAMVMVGLGAILSLQIGSSASPVSGTVFVTILVLSLAALALGHDQIEDTLILTPLLVGACVAVCTANDSSQDYKTLQLCGVRVQDGFIAQFMGLILGAIAVPIALYIADSAYELGSPQLKAPQATMFASVFEAVLIDKSVPLKPISIGALIGVFAVILEVIGQKRKLILPAMAFAVGIYLPPAMGVAILVGSLIRFAAEGKRKRQRGESILTAAGLITGSALLELILGVMIIAGFSEKSLEFGLEASGKLLENGDPEMVPWIDGGILTAGTVAGFLLIGALVYFNSRGAKARE